MILRALRLENFRNHAESLLTFADGCNVLTGKNGEGKTNILEAISFSALTKSFYASHDSEAARKDTSGFTVQSSCVAENGVHYNLLLTYAQPEGLKRILLNKAAVHPISSLVGLIPIVILSPENSGITFGGPAERRRFLDVLLSQASKSYFADISEYRQVLRQRNKILLDARLTKSSPGPLLPPWDEQLCKYGGRIVVRRAEALEQLKPSILRSHEMITGKSEVPSLEYNTSVESNARGDVRQAAERMQEKIDVLRNDERRLGSSLVGPHRDDIEFQLDGLKLRGFASQGQHKTFLVALKLAEFEFLKEQAREKPLLLLDDVFSELDEPRSHNLVGMIQQAGQTFVTATDAHAFPEGFLGQSNNAHFSVQQGTSAREPQADYAR
jgi:DNA replication and repair protein RecF